MMRYFRIAELTLAVEDAGLRLHKELDDFEIEEIDNPDFYINLLYSDRDLLEEKINKAGCQPAISSELLSFYDGEHYLVKYKSALQVDGYDIAKDRDEAVIYVNSRDAKDDDFSLMYSLRDVFFLLASRYGRIAIHSASIVYAGQVWMFSAQSGKGKSTHVRQWEACGYDYKNFNGDITMCYIRDGVALAAGLPWCGTSEVYCNEEYPLGGVFFIMQSFENYVMGLSDTKSVIYMNSRCISPNWTKELMNRNLDVIEQIIPMIKHNYLMCTPKPEAAPPVKEYIDTGYKKF